MARKPRNSRTAGIDTSGKASDVGSALLDHRGHRRAIADALQQSSKRIEKQSKSRLSSRPGGGAYKREPSGIRSVKLRGGAGLIVKAGGTMKGAEFGTEVHYVFGRAKVAGAMKRRVYPRHISAVTTNTNGYVVGKTIRDTMDETQRDVRDAVLTEIAGDLARAGAKVRKAF